MVAELAGGLVGRRTVDQLILEIVRVDFDRSALEESNQSHRSVYRTRLAVPCTDLVKIKSEIMDYALRRSVQTSKARVQVKPVSNKVVQYMAYASYAFIIRESSNEIAPFVRIKHQSPAIQIELN